MKEIFLGFEPVKGSFMSRDLLFFKAAASFPSKLPMD